MTRISLSRISLLAALIGSLFATSASAQSALAWKFAEGDVFFLQRDMHYEQALTVKEKVLKTETQATWVFRFEVQTPPIAVHARKVFLAKRLCRLIRNCGVIAHGSFQAGSRNVCVAKGAAAVHVRRVAPQALPRFRAQR